MSDEFDIVVAADRDGGIGKQGDLPWHLPGDMAHFVRVTRTTRDADKQNAVIMGRVTWQSIPERFRPLKGRLNVVLSRDPDFSPEGAVVMSDLEEAIAWTRSRSEGTFVIGGAQIYRQALALPNCRRVHLTRVDGSYRCDAFLPELEPTYERHEVVGQGTEGSVGYRFEVWKRSL